MQFYTQIGEGSYGAVYKAQDRATNLLVAQKVQTLDNEQEQLEVQKEINIQKSCTCKNIVKYHGSYLSNDKLWISMEYCSIGSLSDQMAICGITLTEEQIASVVKQSLFGQDYQHKHKKIHRDIKSGNILLTDRGECKLADFGVSAEQSSTIAKRQTVIGTPYFMAPEVLESSQYDAKADIWSLAITAYELAVGHPPHANIHPMRAIFIIPTSPPPTLPEPNDFSDVFKDFLSICLQKDINKRPTASELLQHPFIANAEQEPVIQDLINLCQSMLDAYYDDRLNQDNDYSDDYNTDTIVNHNTDMNTVVNLGPSKDTFNSTDDSTIINLMKNLPTSLQDGTVDLSTVAFTKESKYSQKEEPEHLGTIKLMRQKSIKNSSNNNDMSTVAFKTSLKNVVFSNRYVNDLVYSLTFINDKKKIQNVLEQVRDMYSKDLKSLEKFYEEKFNTIQQLLLRNT